MNDLQSNAAFIDVVLPPYLMFGRNVITFRCILHGSPVSFKVSVHPDANVEDLKGEIQKKKKVFRDHDASHLVLWKLNDPAPLRPQSTLGKRIRSRGDVEMFAKELTDPQQRISTLFPQSQLPLESEVCILVQLPPDNSRSWLAIIHSKLWGEHKYFGDIFRTATLTKSDFNELQTLLDIQNPGRMNKSYVTKDVLATKSEFLRRKSTPLVADFGNGLAPRLVFDPSQPLSSDVVGNDDNDADDGDDTVAGDADDGADGGDGAIANDAMNIEPDHCSSDDPHTADLSNEATAIFPRTIRYVDLTVLKLNLRVPPLMLFRNEWGTMIDIFNERQSDMRGSAIFTGQPGIGKTCLLYCILILCIIRGNSRIVFQDTAGKVFIIDDTGVYTPEETPGLSGDDKILTLVDADAKCYEPNDYLLLNHSKCRILLTSSPRRREDRKWLKQIRDSNAVFVMEPWSREEFVVASLFLERADITLKRLQEASYICGNIPRPCFEAAESPAELARAENVITRAIKETKDLLTAVFNRQDGDMNQIFHRAFQVRPVSSEDRFWDSCLAVPVSAWAFSQMLDVLRKRDANAAYSFYCIIKGVPESSTLRGRVFEAHLHQFLKTPRSFTIKSLDDRSATPEICFTSGVKHLDFKEDSFSDDLTTSVKSNTSWYLRPESPVFPSFDSFLY